MNQSFERKLQLYLVGLLIVVTGLLTNFQFTKPLDIQLHDTYFVMRSFDLILLITLLLSSSYLLTLGLKRMIKSNNFLRVFMVLLLIVIGLGLITLVILLVIGFERMGNFSQFSFYYGLIVLFIGLGVFLIIRGIEMAKYN